MLEGNTSHIKYLVVRRLLIGCEIHTHTHTQTKKQGKDQYVQNRNIFQYPNERKHEQIKG